jgi:hypothetical protein
MLWIPVIIYIYVYIYIHCLIKYNDFVKSRSSESMKRSPGAAVKSIMLPCDHEVMDSSPRNNLI